MGHQVGQHSHELQWFNSSLNKLLSRPYKDMESLTLEETNGFIVVFFALTAFVLIYLYVKTQTPFYKKMKSGAAGACSNCCRVCLFECPGLYYICGNLTTHRQNYHASNSDQGLLTQIGDLKPESDIKTDIFVTGQLRNILRATSRAQLFAKQLPSFCEMFPFVCALTLSLAVIIQSGRQAVAEDNYDSPFRKHRAMFNRKLVLIRDHSQSFDKLEQELNQTLTEACVYLKNSDENFFDHDDIKEFLDEFNDISKLKNCRNYFNSDDLLKKLKGETYENALKLKNNFKKLGEILKMLNEIDDGELIDIKNALSDRLKGNCTDREDSEKTAVPLLDTAALNQYKRKSEKILNSLFLEGSLEGDFNDVIEKLGDFLFKMETQHLNLIYQALALAFVSVVGLTLGCYCKSEQMIEYKNAFYKFYAIQIMLLIAILCCASLNLNEITNNRLSVQSKTVVRSVTKILNKFDNKLVVPKEDTNDLEGDIKLILESISKLEKNVTVTNSNDQLPDFTHLINSISRVQNQLAKLHHVMNQIHKISDTDLNREKNRCAEYVSEKLENAKQIHKSLVMVQIILYSNNKDSPTMTNGLETLEGVETIHSLDKFKKSVGIVDSIGHDIFNDILIEYRDTSIDAFDSIYSKYKMLLTALVFIFLASLHMCLYYE